MPFIPHSNEETAAMLKVIGLKHLDDLFSYIPADMHPKSFNLPEGASEQEVCTWFEDVSAKNDKTISFMGGGVYNHSIPKAVDALSGRAEFYTSYTPYQPEAAQGTLQTIFEYQTIVSRLLEMDVANASIYDAGSAMFEAALMAVRHTKRKVLLVDEGINPLYRTMLDTLTANLDVTIETVPVSGASACKDTLAGKLNDKVAAVIVQNPSFLGGVKDYSGLAEKVHAVKSLLIMVVNPVLAAVSKTPGAMDVDIAVAEGQSIGLPMAFGGPYLGILTCKKALIRQLAGRIVGQTKDIDGKVGYVLTLQAREQHIRRQKATSNICSNQALCALRTLIHLSLLGPEGIERVALLSMQRAREAAAALTKIPGVSLFSDLPYGYEFAITLPKPAGEVVAALAKQGIMAGIPAGIFYKGLDNVLLVACTEVTTPAHIETLATSLAAVL